MTPQPGEQTIARTRLAAWRVHRGVTQDELARATGLSRATLIRLEHGRIPNPPVRYLTNCALALGCAIHDLLEDDQRRWTTFDVAAPAPPDPATFWRS